MKTLFILILFVLAWPSDLFAQWKRESGFEIGIVLPDYTGTIQYDDKIGASLKLGAYQSWFKPESTFSFKPMAGISIERLQIDNLSRGGLGGGNNYNGAIWSINGEMAALAQIRIAKSLFFSIGPMGKYLLTDITKVTIGWWREGYGSGESETKGFNREYFYKPSMGIKAMLIEKNAGKRIFWGFSAEKLWKSSAENFIDFTKTTEVSLYIGLR